jgi:hypothetical protein
MNDLLNSEEQYVGDSEEVVAMVKNLLAEDSSDSEEGLEPGLPSSGGSSGTPGVYRPPHIRGPHQSPSEKAERRYNPAKGRCECVIEQSPSRRVLVLFFDSGHYGGGSRDFCHYCYKETGRKYWMLPTFQPVDFEGRTIEIPLLCCVECRKAKVLTRGNAWCRYAQLMRHHGMMNVNHGRPMCLYPKQPRCERPQVGEGVLQFYCSPEHLQADLRKQPKVFEKRSRSPHRKT